MPRKPAAKTEAEVTEEVVEAKAEVPKVDIIRGRMPLAIVYIIRFKEDKSATDATLAAKYRTTNGKISDIRKNRNFSYLADGDVFSADEIADAIALANQLSGDDIDSVKGLIDDLVEGTDEQLAARDAVRVASRKPRGAAAPSGEAEGEPEAEAGADADAEGADFEGEGAEEEALEDLLG